MLLENIQLRNYNVANEKPVRKIVHMSIFWGARHNLISGNTGQWEVVQASAADQ